MKKYFACLFIALFTLIASKRSFGQVWQPTVIAPSDSIQITFVELNYGKVETNGTKRIPDPNSPTGLHSLSANYQFVERTDTVPAVLNTNFGVEYSIKSNVNSVVPIKTVWKFPGKMLNDKNREYSELSRVLPMYTNSRTYSSYKFDEPYEIMPGVWEIEFYYNNKLIYSKKFTVVLVL